MKIKGKYTFVVKEDGNIKKVIESDNVITDVGIDRVLDWLSYNIYDDENEIYGFKMLDGTTGTVTSSGFTNQANAADGNSGSYAYATIDSTSWDNDYWQIDYGENKEIIAIYLKWYEEDTGEDGDYKIQYSTDGSTWTDIETRLRPPVEVTPASIRFFVNPDMSTITARYIRLTTKRYDSSQTFRLYRLDCYEPNAFPQPPMVMKLGDGTTTPASTDTAMSGSNILTKKITSSIKLDSDTVRYIAFVDLGEGNSTTFSEAGMFFEPSNDRPDTSTSTSMFSHVLFDSSWTKTSTETVDVYYDLSVSN